MGSTLSCPKTPTCSGTTILVLCEHLCHPVARWMCPGHRWHQFKELASILVLLCTGEGQHRHWHWSLPFCRQRWSWHLSITGHWWHTVLVLWGPYFIVYFWPTPLSTLALLDLHQYAPSQATNLGQLHSSCASVLLPAQKSKNQLLLHSMWHGILRQQSFWHINERK